MKGKNNKRTTDEEKQKQFKANCEKARSVHKSTEGMAHAERLKAHNYMFR